MAVDIPDAEENILPYLALELHVPSKVARRSAWLPRQNVVVERVHPVNKSVRVGDRRTGRNAAGTKGRDDLCRVGREIAGQQRQQAVKQSYAGANRSLAIVARRVSQAPARRHRTGPTLGLRGKSCSPIGRPVGIQNPMILDEFGYRR